MCFNYATYEVERKAAMILTIRGKGDKASENSVLLIIKFSLLGQLITCLRQSLGFSALESTFGIITKSTFS